jgi:hypothetical protein
MKEPQMTAAGKLVAGAPSAFATWEAIKWPLVKAHVRRLQMRIAKAVHKNRWVNSTKTALEWLEPCDGPTITHGS